MCVKSGFLNRLREEGLFLDLGGGAAVGRSRACAASGGMDEA
jgi:hypothetical protein